MKYLIKIGHVLISKMPTLISVILSFIIENKFSIAKYIPILEDHQHELNIALYTIVLEKLMSWLENYIEKYLVSIECYFYDNKYNAEKEEIYECVNLKINESPSKIYLGIKFLGRYADLKRYYLKITFPTWVDLNDFTENSLLSLDEKIINDGSSISNVIIDFSKLDIEEDNYKDGSKIIPLDFIINSIENLGDKEIIEVKIEPKERISVCEFKSNKLKLFREL